MTGTPASIPGRCKCCRQPIRRGDMIIYDAQVKGYVLVSHLSGANR